jgi:carboxyl-terminal processing protease
MSTIVSIHDPLRAVFRGVVLAAALWAPLASQDTATRARTTYEDLQMFSQVLNQIRVNHPDSVDTHALLMGAIEGMVRTADPHSYVLPYYRLPATLQQAQDDEELFPLPIEFTYQAEAPVVVSVHPGSKAAELDILPGDELVEADGERVSAESAPELDLVLSGRRNSTVSLTLQRRRWDGSLVTLDREVKRERIEETSAVGAALMLDERTGYLRLMHFGNEDMLDDLREQLRDLERSGMQQLVLDLRDNGGGLIEEAGRIAGEFLPRDAIVYTKDGRKSDVVDTVRAEGSSKNRESRIPMVVMVNEGTASAAELVAGALQDHDRALVVGQPTFGKSAIMRAFPMTDGSVIMLVIGHLKTPCGRIIQRRYQDVRTRDYYREAGTVQDTVGRPSCKTRLGRTVYGGGGIYPDHLFEAIEGGELEWFAQLRELQLPLRWLGSYLSDTTLAGVSPREFADIPLPGAVVDNFLAFAAESGVTVPLKGKRLVEELLMLQVAWGQWGATGYYTVAALHDRRVTMAAEQLGNARSLLEGS